MAYTSHGHHIPGTKKEGQPDQVARCGGIGLCKVCLEEAYHAVKDEEPKEFSSMNLDEEFSTFVRKPFTVQAVEVTLENLHEISEFTGELREPPDEPPFIRVDKKRVPNVYNIHIGYWVTRMGNQVRAYNPDVFRTQFTEYTDELNEFFVERDILDDSASARS